MTRLYKQTMRTWERTSRDCRFVGGFFMVAAEGSSQATQSLNPALDPKEDSGPPG